MKGYDGNGIDCIEVEANCAHEDICDVHADCIYNVTLRRNLCVCQVIEKWFKVINPWLNILKFRPDMKEMEEVVI